MTLNIPRYKSFEKRRNEKDRKGSGIVVWTKEDIAANEWLNEEHEEAQTEIIWIKINIEGKKIALGVVILG